MTHIRVFPYRKRKPREWNPFTENLQRYFLTVHRGGISSSNIPARHRLSGFGKEKAKPSVSRVEFWLHHDTVTACHRDTARSGLLRATPTKHRVRNHRRQSTGRFPSPAVPLRLGAGPRQDSRSGWPTPPEPQPRSPSSSKPRSGLASRAPRGPPGRPQNRPGRAAQGPRAPAAQKPRHRCGPSALEADAQRRSPRHVPSAPGERRTRMRAPALPPLSSRRPGSPLSVAVPATAARRRRRGRRAGRGGAGRRARGRARPRFPARAPP